MPYIEVDDGLLAALSKEGLKYKDVGPAIQQAQEYDAAYRKLLASEDSAEFQRIYKKAFPNAVVPADMTADLRAEIAALKKEREEDKAAAEKREAERDEARKKRQADTTVADGRKWLRTEKKLDDEGEKAVEQIMVDKGIADYEVAYNHWKAQQPPEPTSLPNAYGGSRSLDWFKAEESRPDTKLLLNDPAAFRRGEVGKVLQEIREGKLAA